MSADEWAVQQPDDAEGPTWGRKLAVLALSTLALACAVAAAAIGHDHGEWGVAGLFGALLLVRIAAPPSVPAIRRYRRLLEVAAGVVALLGALLSLTTDNVRTLAVLIGILSAVFGILVMLPGFWPQLHERYPDVFGRS